ncbi:hypothetical protein MF406_14270 [Georgenia sp. TF02-10]|uniref:hypothetical protein n=1 Tax=Georgenia sp. TF02-10 TaxID=2917725 RepID=UPI001FA7435B|nr:hypothetical protein [Georgenia sp. TF02-10]UNX54097.1 hypothetical protein MF406_14270 [Georgenia sp. TF02-10]
MSSRYGVVASNAWGKYDVLDTETDEVVASGLITYAQAISAAENYNDRELEDEAAEQYDDEDDAS